MIRRTLAELKKRFKKTSPLCSRLARVLLEGVNEVLDHILEHLGLADTFDANAARTTTLKSRSKRLRDLQRRCCETAEGHRADAADHTWTFAVDPLVVAQEYAAWLRLRKYPLNKVGVLTLADLRWLRAVLHHGRPGSRNFRRAAELLFLAGTFIGNGPEDDTPSPT